MVPSISGTPLPGVCVGLGGRVAVAVGWVGLGTSVAVGCVERTVVLLCKWTRIRPATRPPTMIASSAAASATNRDERGAARGKREKGFFIAIFSSESLIGLCVRTRNVRLHKMPLLSGCSILYIAAKVEILQPEWQKY